MSFLDFIEEYEFEILPLIHDTVIMCIIDGESFVTFTKNAWIGDSGTFCHITNNDTGMYDTIKIDEPVHVNSGNMKVMKRLSGLKRESYI